jgi:ATP-dependent DNA helicase RecG
MPLSLTAEEFTAEFPGESQLVEFKTGLGQTFRDTVVSFSNTSGGVTLIGVTDDGEIVGRSLDSGTADAVHEAMRAVNDPGRYEIHELLVGDKQIVVIGIATREEGFAQTSNGIVRVRNGTRDDALFGSDLTRFIQDRSSARFESTSIDVSVDAADPAQLSELAAAYGWSSDIQDRLVEAGFARDGRLTIAGVLFLITRPSEHLGKAVVEVLRYPNDETIDYDRRQELHGPLPDQLREASNAVMTELGTELVVLGVRRYELPRIPEVVVREAVANALAHRSYELNRAAVRIELRPSSVLIASPGRLPEPVTIANMREVNAPRNLVVIDALRRFGLAEDAGRGIDVMEDAMQQEMLEPPRFTESDSGVQVRLPVRSAVAPVERAWVRELERRGALAGPDRLALVHAARGETLTNSRVRTILGVDAAEARQVLQRLRDEGFLEQRGERGGASYHLEGSLRPPAGLRLTEDELSDLVVGLAAGGEISNSDVRAATGLDRTETLAILGRLVGEGRLVRTGERRGTRYSQPET